MKHRVMNSLLFALLLSFALMLVLVSCGGEVGGTVAPIVPAPQPDTAEPSQTQPSDAQPAETAPAAPEETEPSVPSAPTVTVPAEPEAQTPAQPEAAASTDPVPSAPAQPLTMEGAFRAALETICTDRLYPNGEEVSVLPDTRMDDKDFAVFDVDGDGVDELIFRNDNTVMTGMIVCVYGFDPDAGKLFQELEGFVAMDFYDNGVVVIQSSHNHGMGQMEEFWPFAIYQYDPGSDGYLMAGYMDGWDGTFFPVDYEGNPFPDDIDQDGDKAVYILTAPGPEVIETVIDGPEYQQWVDSYLAGAAKLDLPWQSMTPENIQAVAP